MDVECAKRLREHRAEPHAAYLMQQQLPVLLESEPLLDLPTDMLACGMLAGIDVLLRDGQSRPLPLINPAM